MTGRTSYVKRIRRPRHYGWEVCHAKSRVVSRPRLAAVVRFRANADLPLRGEICLRQTRESAEQLRQRRVLHIDQCLQPEGHSVQEAIHRLVAAGEGGRSDAV